MFGDGLAAVKFADTGLWGYIDKNGETVIPAQYRSATNFREGYAFVEDESGGRYINVNGEPLATKFQSGSLFDGGLASALNSDDQLGLFDTGGNLVTLMDKGVSSLLSYKEEVNNRWS